MSDNDEKEKKSSLDILSENNVFDFEDEKKSKKKSKYDPFEQEENKNATTNVGAKDNVVPSYKKVELNLNNSNKGNTKKIKSKITLICIIVIIAIIVIFTVSIILGKIKRANVNYETYMYNFRLNKMYTNENAKSSEEVTKIEALKLIVNTSLNVDDLSFYFYGKKESYKDEFWVKTALDAGMITKDEINQSNYNEKVKYVEVLKWLGIAKQKLLKKNLSATKKNVKIDGYDMYDSVTQSSIADLIETNVLENKNINLDKIITKSEMNKLIIEYSIANNTFTLEGDKVNISKEKAPSNESEYPYILFGIDKSVYETKNYVKNKANYLTPVKAFGELRTHYESIVTNLEEYYNYILNIDYEKINEEEFAKKVHEYSLYGISDENIADYINYIKLQKIKLSGTAKVQLPIIYFDGEVYRARIKLTYKIENSDTDKSVLLGDRLDEKEVDYKNKNGNIFIDAPFSYSDINKIYYVKISKISNNISGNVKE